MAKNPHHAAPNGKPLIKPVPGLAPVPARILAMLSDGLPHHRDELAKCLEDEYAAGTAVYPRLTHLRAHLRLRGEDILVQFIKGRAHYRVVRLLSNGQPIVE